MNDRKRKILIGALIAITLIVIIYIVYLFMGKRGPISNTDSGGTFSSFSSLLSRKKTTPGGSQINQNGTPVDIGGSDTDIPTDITIDPLNPGNPGNPGGIDPNNPNNPGGVNPGGVDIDQQGGFTPLPDPINPGGGGKIINPNDPNETPDDITKIEPTPDVKKKKPCDKTNLPKGVADILCDPGGLLPNGEVSIVNFSLNDEEQAELDRLNRMFARLAPYLKTKADISREGSNAEAYEGFAVEATRLSRDTNIEVASASYKGPRNVKSPFLTSSEFGARLMLDLKNELIGENGGSFVISPIQLIGLKLGEGMVGKIFDNISDEDKVSFFKGIEDTVMNTLTSTLNNFVQKQIEQTTGIVERTDLPCDGSFDNCVGSKLFEKTLNIY